MEGVTYPSRNGDRHCLLRAWYEVRSVVFLTVAAAVSDGIQEQYYCVLMFCDTAVTE